MRHNRRVGESDEDTVEEWEAPWGAVGGGGGGGGGGGNGENGGDGGGGDGDGNGEGEGDGMGWEEWEKVVQRTKPNVEVDAAVVEVRELRERVEGLMRAVEGLRGELVEKKGNGGG